MKTHNPYFPSPKHLKELDNATSIQSGDALLLYRDGKWYEVGATATAKYGVTGTLASVAGVVTIDVSAAADLYQLALTENVTSWVFTNLPPTGTFRDIAVTITQHASAAKTVVSPGDQTAGGAWTQSATLGDIETLTLRIYANGLVELFPSGVFA